MNKSRLSQLVLLIFFLLGSTSALASDYYVVTNSFRSQQKAQKTAALKGGWVLNTNLYDNLQPNYFAVVRGPFHAKREAKKVLKFLKGGENYKSAYIKNAGELIISEKISGTNIKPVIIAAMLGEIKIEIKKHRGGNGACVPQEPYNEIELSFISLNRSMSGKFTSVKRRVNIGGFWQIIRTGQIERMRVCAE